MGTVVRAERCTGACIAVTNTASAKAGHRRWSAALEAANYRRAGAWERHSRPMVSQARDRGSSLQASQQSGTCSKVKLFDWHVWWQLVHTGCLPSVIVVNFVPEICVVAFSMFHFTGTLGTSESHTESIGGTLKRFASH